MHFYQAPNLPKEKHAFFGRTGGVSKGIYQSLNFNFRSQDTAQNIEANLEKIGDFFQLSGKNVVRLLQSHSNVAVYVDKPSQYEFEADGVVTNQPNLILGITTADCIPVILADYQNGVIGAAHAGWRGALSGVLENTVKLMLEKGAEIKNIKAASGPCLQKPNFEVKEDMYNLFIEQDKNNQQFFEKINQEIFLCDLEKFVESRLQKIGIHDISLSGIDTYSNADLYFSYRRSCHQKTIPQPADFGIELSTICL